jgi:superfamily II DNA helicase RecQ
VLALTATVDKATQEDIRHQLKLNSPKTFLQFRTPQYSSFCEQGYNALNKSVNFSNSMKVSPASFIVWYDA